MFSPAFLQAALTTDLLDKMSDSSLNSWENNWNKWYLTNFIEQPTQPNNIPEAEKARLAFLKAKFDFEHARNLAKLKAVPEALEDASESVTVSKAHHEELVDRVNAFGSMLDELKETMELFVKYSVKANQAHSLQLKAAMTALGLPVVSSSESDSDSEDDRLQFDDTDVLGGEGQPQTLPEDWTGGPPAAKRAKRSDVDPVDLTANEQLDVPAAATPTAGGNGFRRRQPPRAKKSGGKSNPIEIDEKDPDRMDL